MLIYSRLIIFFVGVFQPQSTDHIKSITYLKVTEAETIHQNSSLEERTQGTFIYVGENDERTSNVIIRGL